MSNATDDPRLERIEQGLNALFATEVAAEVLEAVDFEAILSDQPVEDPVDVEHLADALGRPVGRILANRVVGGSGASGLVARTVASEVGSRVTAGTFRVAVENVDTEAVTEALVELDEETLPGPTVREVVEPAIEESDLLTLEAFSVPQDVSDAEAGADASGVHDAAGDDHAGVLDEASADGEGGSGESGLSVPVEEEPDEAVSSFQDAAESLEGSGAAGEADPSDADGSDSES